MCFSAYLGIGCEGDGVGGSQGIGTQPTHAAFHPMMHLNIAFFSSQQLMSIPGTAQHPVQPTAVAGLCAPNMGGNQAGSL